ncbi:MAG: 4'-phosphopantetheinyl transferase superfamily protein [Clostridia bacterium]|nr:4'-phosphopantetheinyl transferase superfamily protein [Clostridia bacterium]
MATFTDVYFATLPEVMGRRAVYPPERESYILQATNPQLMRQRYYVWLLLEYALQQSLGKGLSELHIQKSPHGKWESPFAHFSLAHSHKALAVAVSDTPVGVDIQKQIEKTTVANCALTDSEWTRFLSAQNPSELLTELWTKKESLFKTTDKLRFSPKEIHAEHAFTQTEWLEIDGERYALSTTSPIRKLQQIQL